MERGHSRRSRAFEYYDQWANAVFVESRQGILSASALHQSAGHSLLCAYRQSAAAASEGSPVDLEALSRWSRRGVLLREAVSLLPPALAEDRFALEPPPA